MNQAINYSIFLALFFFAVGVQTSVTLGAIGHIFIFIPGIYFFIKEMNSTKHKKFYENTPLSNWFLLLFFLSCLSSLFFTTVPIEHLMGNVLKSRYYLLAFISVFAYKYFFQTEWGKNKAKILIYSFLISATVATLSGLWALQFGFNPIKMKAACHLSRACGLFGMYMTYGYGVSLFCSLLLPFLFNKKEVEKKISYSFLVTVFIINLLGLILSYCRGAWIGFLVSIPFAFFYKNKKLFFAVIIGAIMSSSLAYLFIPKVRDTFERSDRQESNRVRSAMYKTAIKAYLENPLWGMGFKNFEPHSREIKKKYNIEYDYFQGHAHNNFLEVLASNGIFGLIFFVLWILSWFKESFSRYQQSKSWMAEIDLVFLVSFIVSGLTQYTFGDGENLFLILNVYALTTALRNSYGN